MKISLLELLDLLRNTYIEIPEQLTLEPEITVTQEKSNPQKKPKPSGSTPAKQKRAELMEKVWQLMEKDGKKAEDVAFELGISKVTVYRYHSAKANQPKIPPVDTKMDPPKKPIQFKKWHCVACNNDFGGEVYYNRDNQIICKKCHQVPPKLVGVVPQKS